MDTGHKPEDLKLTEDEAFALLGLCMMSPGPLDNLSLIALRKLADHCAQRGAHKSNSIDLSDQASNKRSEFHKAGA